MLLRTILGLRRPDGGTVELYGRDVAAAWPPRTGSSLVQSYGVTFQNGALISSLTVAQNIQLPLREYYSLSGEHARRAGGAESAAGGPAAGRRREISLRSCPAA